MFQDVTMEGRRHWAAANLARFGRDWRAPESTRFDRYLPWAARELNRIYKPYKRLAKKEGLPGLPPGYDLGSRRFRQLHPELDAHRALLNALSIQTRTVQDGFRGIVDWAEGSGVDLNQYHWEDALGLASSWGETHGESDVAQGNVVFVFPDGWTVQELTTAEQLDDEDASMQHCVGEYFDEVSAGTVRIFSLRTPVGYPHATLEWNVERGFVVQLKGRQNAPPLRAYLLRMIPFRHAVLDPLAKVRPQPGFDPGFLTMFRDTYLGAWAFNPEGTLDDKIGGFGALEAAMENDVLYLVYEWDATWTAYALKDLHAGIFDIEDSYDESNLGSWDDSLSEEENIAIHDQERLEGLQAWARRTRVELVADAADEAGLDWAIWNAHGLFPKSVEDEMVEQLDREGLLPGTVVAEIKGRLLS
jgi:hypothetical protein